MRRLELMTEAEITILRQQLLHAQVQALVGMANLTVQERAELAGAMRGIVRGIDGSLEQLAVSLESYGVLAGGFDALDDNQAVSGHFTDAAAALRSAKVMPTSQQPAERALPQEKQRPQGQPSRDQQRPQGQPSRDQQRPQGQPSRDQQRPQAAQQSGRERDQGQGQPSTESQQTFLGDDELSDEDLLALRAELMREKMAPA